MPIERRQTPRRHAGFGLVLVASLVACSGASCNSRFRSPFAASASPAPQVLAPTATIEQVVAAVNANTARVQTYVTNSASISVPGGLATPRLRGNIAVERPRRLRLRAGTAITGPEVDLGSNDELYWLWSKRNDPPAVFFARHAEHAGSVAQQFLPIEPEWLLDALGLLTLDPNAAYQGPMPRPDGTLEIRLTEPSPLGRRQRVIVVDQTRGWVLEQHAYDASGAALASATADDFYFDPLSQTSLPRTVTLRVPSADLALTIETGDVVVNSPVGNGPELFGLPVFDGTPQIDLGRSNALPTVAATGGRLLQAAPGQRSPAPGSAALPSGPPPAAVSSPAVPKMSRLPAGGVPLLR